MGTTWSQTKSHIPSDHNKLVLGYVREQNKQYLKQNVPNVINYGILLFYSMYDYFGKCGTSLNTTNFLPTGTRNQIQPHKTLYPMAMNTAYGNQSINVSDSHWIKQYRWLCSVSKGKGQTTIGIDSSNQKWTYMNFTHQIKYKEYGVSGVNPYYAFVIDNKRNEIFSKEFDGVNYRQSNKYFMINKMEHETLPLDFVGPEPDWVHDFSSQNAELDDVDVQEDDGIWYYISLIVEHNGSLFRASMEIVNEFDDKTTSIGDVKVSIGDQFLCYRLAVCVENPDQRVILHDFREIDCMI